MMKSGTGNLKKLLLQLIYMYMYTKVNMNKICTKKT